MSGLSRRYGRSSAPGGGVPDIEGLDCGEQQIMSTSSPVDGRGGWLWHGPSGSRSTALARGVHRWDRFIESDPNRPCVVYSRHWLATHELIEQVSGKLANVDGSEEAGGQRSVADHYTIVP